MLHLLAKEQHVLLTTRPDELKRRSHGTDVAGTNFTKLARTKKRYWDGCLHWRWYVSNVWTTICTLLLTVKAANPVQLCQVFKKQNVNWVCPLYDAFYRLCRLPLWLITSVYTRQQTCRLVMLQSKKFKRIFYTKTHRVDPWNQSEQDHQCQVSSVAERQHWDWTEESPGMCCPASPACMLSLCTVGNTCQAVYDRHDQLSAEHLPYW